MISLPNIARRRFWPPGRQTPGARPKDKAAISPQYCPCMRGPPTASGLSPPLSGPELSNGPSKIDEALLRELIRDVLREELQGDLGERITRNVRKLIRAELARALTARDLI